MKLTRLPRRTSPESIIPLIDVVFFLLIFFMLIGRMDATAPFEVTPAIALTGTDMPGGGITLSIGATGDLALDGQAMQQSTLLAALSDIIAQNPARLIRINAHKAAQLSEVLPMVARIEEMGAREVVLVVTPNAP